MAIEAGPILTVALGGAASATALHRQLSVGSA